MHRCPFFPQVGEGGFWWGHCRTGHAERGKLQGLHSDNAVATWQPDIMDLRHAGRWWEAHSFLEFTNLVEVWGVFFCALWCWTVYWLTRKRQTLYYLMSRVFEDEVFHKDVQSQVNTGPRDFNPPMDNNIVSSCPHPSPPFSLTSLLPSVQWSSSDLGCSP